MENERGCLDGGLRRRAALRDEFVDELFELARFHEERHVLRAHLPVHLREVERLRLHERHEVMQVSAPRGHRSGELALQLGVVGVRRCIGILLQRGELGVERGQTAFDVGAQFVALLRGGRGKQHLLGAACAQHVAAHFFRSAARHVALVVDGLRRCVEAADLREREYADGERADQQEGKGETQRRLHRKPREAM
jgi:hypothetical protein